MEHIGKFVAYLILAVNALFVGTLILSAYSPYLNPKINPLASSLGLAFPIFLTINLIFIGFWAFVNYCYALLPAIGFLICIPQIRTYIPFNSTTKTIPEGSIKSYPITYEFNNLEKKDGKNPVLSYLVDSNADIICLQEYNTATNKKYLTEQDIKKSIESLSLPIRPPTRERRCATCLFLQVPHTSRYIPSNMKVIITVP